MQLRSFILITLILITASTFAQSRKNKRKSNRTEQSKEPTTLDPLAPQRDYTPKASKKNSKGATYESEERYYERMAALEKTKRKNEKLSEKPQYSDPAYFGHKRPPKRNKAGKLKFCKECGIRH